MIRSLQIVVCFVVLIGTTEKCLQAAEPITVHVKSGRKFSGDADPRSSDQSLRLRCGQPSAFVVRSIDWDRIEQVTIGERQLGVDEFRTLLRSPQWQSAENPFVNELPAPSDVVAKNDEQPVEIQPVSWTPPEPAELPRRVAWIEIDATVGNWDGGVEADGIVLRVYPLDANGEITRVLGTLDVDLTGEAPTNGVAGDPFPRLAYWSRIVHAEDVGPGGAVLRLPFQSVHPDFLNIVRLGNYGMVHARFSVGGQGTFEATAAFTRIRQYSPTRDRLQQMRGTRFLPQERVDSDRSY